MIDNSRGFGGRRNPDTQHADNGNSPLAADAALR
jgi:hypothetical protein